MEPVKWPIAPDGYIPNSVVRSWRRRGKEPTKTDCCVDNFFYSLHPVDECTTNDEEDVSTRTLWFIPDEEEEKEKTVDVKNRMKKKEDDNNQKDKVEQTEVEGKVRVDGKKEKEEDKMDRTVLVKQCYNIHTKITLQNQLKTFDDRKMNDEPQDVSSTHNSKKTVNFPPTFCPENGHKPLRELREDMKLPETITPPFQYLSEPNKERTSSLILKELLEPPVESPVVSADTLITKQESWITSCIPPIEPQNLTPHPLKPPSPKPPSATPEDPQPGLGPRECSPVRDKTFLLSLTKYNKIRDQAQVHLDLKVLELYKKIKGSKNNSHLGKLSTTVERPPASKTTRSTIQTNTGRVNLKGYLGSPPEFRATLSTIQTQLPKVIYPECPSHPLCSNYPAQFAQIIPPIKDQRSHKSMPEWRKNMYKVISLQGFCSPRAARLAAPENLVKSSNARQLVATIPSLQPGQAAAHQRVIQNIQMKDSPELPSFHYHHVIPMASQHSFVTLNPHGKTQYGRLQFDWIRGSEKDELLNVSQVKTKDSAH